MDKIKKDLYLKKTKFYKIFKTDEILVSKNFIMIIKNNKLYFIRIKTKKYIQKSGFINFNFIAKFNNCYEYNNFLKIKINENYKVFNINNLKSISLEEVNKTDSIDNFYEIKDFLKVKINGSWKVFNKINFKILTSHNFKQFNKMLYFNQIFTNFNMEIQEELKFFSEKNSKKWKLSHLRESQKIIKYYEFNNYYKININNNWWVYEKNISKIANILYD